MGARPSTLFFLPTTSFMPTLMLRLKDQLAARRQSVSGKRTKLRQFWRKPGAVIPQNGRFLTGCTMDVVAPQLRLSVTQKP